MADVVELQVLDLIDKELEYGKINHGLFKSKHEGYAVLLEEFEETKDELEALEIEINRIWDGVKCDKNAEEHQNACNNAFKYAVRVAIEAIQTAAMARKNIISNYNVLSVEKEIEHGR